MARYEIYALWLGSRMAESARFFYLTQSEKLVTISYYLWLLKGREETILIDTGFGPESAQKRGVGHYAHPLERLAQLRVNPMSVQAVIVSHLHWDHFATPEYFPQATFYLQEREAQFFTGPYARYQAFNQFVDPDSVAKMVQLNYQGRFRLLPGTEEIRPGLRVHLTGGHTPGHQIVEAEVSRGRAVLGADSCHLYRNLEEMVPGGIIVDLREMVKGLELIRKLASSPDLVFPGHDPALLDRFPQVAEGIVHLA
jgi:glyoxylase-like metal-dependent hydrolase (beta-lactamase superfamily II)